jgi:hypothetical protein
MTDYLSLVYCCVTNEPNMNWLIVYEIMLDWTKTFLAKRSQQVVVDGEASRPALVTSRVPQWTVLGPLLILVYINNDSLWMTVYSRNIDNEANSNKLQEDVDRLQNGKRQGWWPLTQTNLRSSGSPTNGTSLYPHTPSMDKFFRWPTKRCT